MVITLLFIINLLIGNLIDPLDLIGQTKQFLDFAFHFLTQYSLFPFKNIFQILQQLVIEIIVTVILSHECFHLMETRIST